MNRRYFQSPDDGWADVDLPRPPRKEPTEWIEHTAKQAERAADRRRKIRERKRRREERYLAH